MYRLAIIISSCALATVALMSLKATCMPGILWQVAFLPLLGALVLVVFVVVMHIVARGTRK